jgi:hypothetical protein
MTVHPMVPSAYPKSVGVPEWESFAAEWQTGMTADEVDAVRPRLILINCCRSATPTRSGLRRQRFRRRKAPIAAMFKNNRHSIRKLIYIGDSPLLRRVSACCAALSTLR